MISPTGILAVAVLYKRSAGQSEAVISMRALLASTPSFADLIELMICDNTPFEQPAPPGFNGLYLRQPENPGLAACYNHALTRAEASSAPWLMLLDQDTTVTADYLREVADSIAELAPTPEVVAIVPQLVEHGDICSPSHPPVYRPSRREVTSLHAVSSTRLHAFNSGAVLRARAVRDAGGFPADFPLDYLDHATFAALQNRGGKIFVLRAQLQHELSSNDQTRTDAAFAERQRSVLDAEFRFYTKYGSPKERLLRRFRLLRAAAGRILRRKPAAQTLRMLRSAVRL